MVIGLHLHDQSADAPDHQRCADQVGRDVMDAAREKFAPEPDRSGHRRCSSEQTKIPVRRSDRMGDATALPIRSS
jgi:hypothetical protein